MFIKTYPEYTVMQKLLLKNNLYFCLIDRLKKDGLEAKDGKPSSKEGQLVGMIAHRRRSLKKWDKTN